MIPLEIHGDLGRAKVVMLPQVDDLAHHLGLGRVRANQQPTRPFAKSFRPELLISTQPEVIRVPRDSELPARHGDIAINLLDVLDDGKSPSCSLG